MSEELLLDSTRPVDYSVIEEARQLLKDGETRSYVARTLKLSYGRTRKIALNLGVYKEKSEEDYLNLYRKRLKRYIDGE